MGKRGVVKFGRWVWEHKSEWAKHTHTRHLTKDCSPKCRAFLGRKCKGHRFGDMRELIQLDAWDYDWPYITKMQALSRATITPTMYCYECNQHCLVTTG